MTTNSNNRHSNDLSIIPDNLESKEKAKNKYLSGCKEYRLNVTPCVSTTNCILGDEFKALLSIIAKN